MTLLKKDHTLLRGVAITVLVFALMALVLVFALGKVDNTTQDEQNKALEDAVRGATMMCYAVEGRYPFDVDYLRKHYGIYYDQNKYIVRIDGFADNVLPEIRVLKKGTE